MKYSTATSVFVNYGLADALDQVIKAGFDGVDVWCGRPHLYRKDYPQSKIMNLGKKLADHNVTPVSLMPAFFRYPYSLSSPNDVIRQDSIDYVKDCMENCNLIGGKQVLIVPSRCLHGQDVEDAREKFYDSLRQLIQLAELSNIILGMEILNANLSEYMCTSEDAKKALAALNSPCLKVVLDTGHVNLTGEDFFSAMQNLGDSLVQVHINDNDGLNQQNSIPGKGNFKFDQLAENLAKVNYDGFLSLELGWHYSPDPVPAAVEGLEKIKMYMGDKG